VELLGYGGKLTWKQTPGGLAVDLPAKNPGKFAYAFRISM
jgi:hypothetical protein